LARIGERGVKPLVKSLLPFFKITGNKRESERGEASLTYSFPLPPIKGRGEKGDGVTK